jgi:transposase-like protein
MEHAVRAAQPAAALRATSALREELDAFERLQVARALDAGQSFGDVARALGISRQAAHRRYRDLAGITLPEGEEAAERRVVVTSEARTAVDLAREEALAMGAPAVGSEHLLLGIIRCRARGIVELLESGGVTLAEARRCAQPTLAVEGAGVGRRGVSPYASSVFDGALRVAVERGDAFVGAEHLLLASLEDPSGGAWRTLSELGLDPESVRAALAG